VIRKCETSDYDQIFDIINNAASAYKGVIPEECWSVPYMSDEYLHEEINNHVEFWGYESEGELVGVMGIQIFAEVTLIRHAYVKTSYRNKGIGGKLLKHLKGIAQNPIVIGTWAKADWAVKFYEKHDFTLVESEQGKNRLLDTYWNVDQIHRISSVVLKQKP